MFVSDCVVSIETDAVPVREALTDKVGSTVMDGEDVSSEDFVDVSELENVSVIDILFD